MPFSKGGVTFAGVLGSLPLIIFASNKNEGAVKLFGDKIQVGTVIRLQAAKPVIRRSVYDFAWKGSLFS